MAQLTVLNIMDFVQDYIPDCPQAKIVRKTNLVLQRIYGEIGQVARSTFTTKASVSTGTVTATNGSVGLTFTSGVLSATAPLSYIQISGSSTWYTVTRDGADTNGTLSSFFDGTTGAGLTFTICYPSISFPTSVLQVLGIWREGFDPLKFADVERTARIFDRLTVGTPEWYSPYLTDTTGTSPDDEKLRFLLLPAPSTVQTLTYAYKVRPTLLDPAGATTQTSGLPDFYNEAILNGTLFYLWDQEDKQDRSAFWKDQFESAWKRAMAQLSVNVDTRMDDAYDGVGLSIFDNRPIG